VLLSGNRSQAAARRNDEPLLSGTQALGRAAAKACWARHPVQCPGTMSSGCHLGERSDRRVRRVQNDVAWQTVVPSVHRSGAPL
jgi:hypothetical protein